MQGKVWVNSQYFLQRVGGRWGFFISSAAVGPWLCSHLPHGTPCAGHTQTQKLSDRKSLYLHQVQRRLFASTPIKPFLAAPHHMLPPLNSWDAEFLAAEGWNHFQSAPPQRKRSLTPSSPRTSQKSSQCCHFYRRSSVRQYTHGRLMCELGRLCVGAGFLLKKVITESRQKDAFRMLQAEIGQEVVTNEEEGILSWWNNAIGFKG